MSLTADSGAVSSSTSSASSCAFTTLREWRATSTKNTTPIEGVAYQTGFCNRYSSWYPDPTSCHFNRSRAPGDPGQVSAVLKNLPRHHQCLTASPCHPTPWPSPHLIVTSPPLPLFPPATSCPGCHRHISLSSIALAVTSIDGHVSRHSLHLTPTTPPVATTPRRHPWLQASPWLIVTSRAVAFVSPMLPCLSLLGLR
jgi:hypothetical protein